jgi:phosphatidylcholine synthase
MEPAHARGVFLVHVLTASGAGWALMALHAAVERRWSAMFFWLGVALIVDGIDGPLARRFAVLQAMPRWSGATLDLVVDYVAYVFVPAYAIADCGMLPPLLAMPAGVAVAVSGALYFADQNMKLAGNFFRGFPALWNAAAFYLILLSPPPWLAAVSTATLVAATFMPFAFVHPLRVVAWRAFTLAALAAWSVLGLVALWYNMAPGPWVTLALCAIGLYFCAIGIVQSDSEPKVT